MLVDIIERKKSERLAKPTHMELRAHADEQARFNRAAVNRELRVIELKAEVNALCERLAQAPRYSLSIGPAPVAKHPGCRLPGEEGDGVVPLESIVCTEQLLRRPARPPDYESETQALAALVQALADSPRTILQTLSEKVVDILRAGSAGLSLLTADGTRFYWAAIAGAWSPHCGGGTPRDFGPCGDVLNRQVPLLFTHWERRYPYLSAATPLAEEGLLVPFKVADQAVGTIWAIAHDPDRRFDAEDLRLLESLSHFASAAYQAVETLGEIDERRAALSLMEDYANIAEERLRLLNDVQEADRRKDEFLATLAHELRNPLAPIRNAVEILRMRGPDDPDLRWSREIIERQVTHLTRIVDDLLDVSRITRNKLELRQECIDLADVVNCAVETSRPFIDECRHELTIQLPSGPVYLHADRVRLAQIFMNLLTNAAKYTEPGGRIWLIAERQANEVLVRVKDNGVGIAAEKLPHLFDLFFQASPALERSQGGLGIGLSLVRRLVELHHGTIEAHSDGLRQGSEFTVRLPVLAEPPTLAPRDSNSDSRRKSAIGRRILVVDDLADSANSLAMALRLAGNTVETAYDGLTAIEITERFGPDIVFLDIAMPRLNGYDACSFIRKQPWGRSVVLVALTGWGAEADRRRTEEAGFDAHLVKPVDAKEMYRILADLVG